MATATKTKSFETGASSGKLAMWIFLGSDALTFAALLAAYGALRIGDPNWPLPTEHLNIPLTAFNTFVLICSSVSMVLALHAAKHDNKDDTVKYLLMTIAGGVFFLGVQVYEYYHLIHDGIVLSKDLFSATFYATTCFHGMHVFGGVVYLSCIAWAAAQGRYGSKNYDSVEIVGLYWHFVDLVWILVFTFIYLL